MVEALGIFSGFVLGVTSCWLFWRWQLTIKPEFKVSDKIAVRPSTKDASKPIYQIKIINLSSRPIIKMRAMFGIHEINDSGRGPGRRTIHVVKLNPSTETIIGPYVKKYDPWAITSVHYYTSEPDANVKELLTEQKNERRLVLTIQATDSLSNTTILARFTYNKDDILSGHFETRRGLNILPLNNNERNVL